MGHEAVFYFEVLDFRHLAARTIRVAVYTFDALAEVLHSLTVSQQTASWSYGYSLDGSVCVKHTDLDQALRLAKVVASQPLCTFLSATAVQEIGDTTGGLLDEYDTAPLRLIESIGR